jgi:DNA polymerase-1
MLGGPLSPDEVLAELDAAGLERGSLIALAVAPDGGATLAVGDRTASLSPDHTPGVVRTLDLEQRPRWVVWNSSTSSALLAAGMRLSTSWDLAAVHRLLRGGWRADPARVWAALHDLDHHALPTMGQLDLLASFGDEGDHDVPVRPDGYLRPEWLAGAWADSELRRRRWASTLLHAAERQRAAVREVQSTGAIAGDLGATARAESTAELLCAELAFDGLPIDRDAADRLITAIVGPRPVDERDASEMRRRRDAQVLQHLPPGSTIDLRNPADVKSMLRRLGIDVPDTRAWRLEPLRDVHPAVEALLAWRKAERVATTFGHGWLADHVAADGRLRGAWSASDGAAGRMTAQAGLHNLPAELRPIVSAGLGHRFVRADLGQIEPRVLAAISGDSALRAATADDDLYLPVAQRLGVDRSVAKVAVLAAMYGQTSGTAGQALRGMESAYPQAIRFLDDAARQGQQGVDLRTFGGRLVRMYDLRDGTDYSAGTAARGRYARNAMVQGAAAELFKLWAVTVRARVAAMGARVVLCLHDELLVHAPESNAAEVARVVDECLGEAAHRWFPSSGVRFVADISTIATWDQAK